MADNPSANGQVRDDPVNALPDVVETPKTGADQRPEEPFLHTWKSREDAEEGVQNIIKQRDRAATELQKSGARIEELEKTVADLTSKVAGALTDSRRTGEGAEAQQQLKELAERIDSGDLSGKEMVDLLLQIRQQATEEARKEIGERSKALEDSLKDLESNLSKRLVDLDPAYQQHREAIDAAQEKFGVDRATAMKIVAAYENEPSQPPRPGLPGISALGVPLGSSDDGVNRRTANLVAGIAAAVTGRKPSEQQIKAAASKWGDKK